MKMQRIFAAALVAAAPPLAAGADTCPTGADLGSGITLSMDDGSFSMLTRKTPQGIEVTSTSIFSNGDPFTSVAIFAHPLAMPLQAPGPQPTDIRYDAPVSALDDLMATRSWTSTFAFVRDGAEQAQGTQTTDLTGLGQITIGACSYDTWRVNREIAFDDGFSINSELIFARDLGIIVAETTLDAEGAPLGAVFFDQIAAE